MVPMVVALICAAVFGSVMVITAFLRQIMLSRDKRLNEEAHIRALKQQSDELARIRIEMHDTQRLQVHYQLFGKHDKKIESINKDIADLFREKEALMQRYSEEFIDVIKQNREILVQSEASNERKELFDKLRHAINPDFTFYDKQIDLLQQQRLALLKNNKKYENSLLAQEKARNAHLDEIYRVHSNTLEKIYLSYIKADERVTVETIKAGTIYFKDLLMAPIHFLTQVFRGGIAAVVPNISVVQTRVEHISRTEVEKVERELNTQQPEINHDKSDKEIGLSDSSDEDSEEEEIDLQTNSVSFTFAS
ncbi:MAG: hypothetical protein QM652_10040 [Legionella sp.]|uniref:hypothetical protein n=1 Tax=Legionella sp. TaxID=459 RepID=UPI0039E26ECA